MHAVDSAVGSYDRIMSTSDEVDRRRRVERRVIGQNVARLRTQRGWTQEQLAEKSSVGLGMVKMIESGRRNGSPKTHEKLAMAFRVRVGMIVEPPEMTSESQKDLDRFLRSGLADDITEEEKSLLSTVTVPGREMTPRAYMKALEMIRETVTIEH